MKEFVVYTAMRIGLFLVTWGVVTGVWALITDEVPFGATFLIALVISGVGSYFVLKGPREKLAQHVEARAGRMAAAMEERRQKEDAE